jgi:hypothetical protein
MGWISMSERDLQRIEVLSEVLAGRRTVAAAASVLEVSEWQASRLLALYQAPYALWPWAARTLMTANPVKHVPRSKA